VENITLHIEALVFASESPLPLRTIQKCIESITDKEYDKSFIQNKVTALQQKYLSDNYAFRIVEVAKGYQFLTKDKYIETVGTLIKQKSKKKLTKASLETLSIIAYKQPVTKSEIERIRGVNCDYTVRKLLEKELVQIKGRSEDVGRPLLYGTSDKFMEHFGLNTIRDLPKLREFKEEDNQIGEINEE